MNFSHVFLRIKKYSPFRVGIIAFFIFSFLFIQSNIAFAEGYEKYRDLFGQYTGEETVVKGTPAAINRTESGIFYKGSTGFYDGIKELYLGANLFFPGITKESTSEDIEKKIWDFISNINAGDARASQTFVVRYYRIVNGEKQDVQYNTQIYEAYYRPTAQDVAIPSVYSPGAVTFPASQAKIKFFKREDYTKSGVVYERYILDQRINIPLKFTTAVPYGSEMGADFWYCAGEADEGDNGEKYPDGDLEEGKTPAGFEARVAYFPGLCSGTAYWKIGPSITFTLPASSSDGAGGAIKIEEATAGASDPVASTTQAENNGGLPVCWSGFTDGGFNVIGCIAQTIYYLLFVPMSWIATLIGKLFDFFIGFSLSDESYRYAFAVTGWKLVRDIANIFFIVILVYAGFSAIFKTANVNLKKILPWLIFNALVINFSLFFTRTIIDLSNIGARVFYSRIYVCNGDCKDENQDGKIDNFKRGAGDYWPLSEKIISSFNPQRILSESVLSKAGSSTTPPAADRDGNFDAQNQDSYVQRNTDVGSPGYAIFFIIISLVGAIIMFAIAKMFWGVAFMFLGRVIGLYVSMIFSPIAFLSQGDLPLVSKLHNWTWKKWLGELGNYAILAPIFTLFLYLIYGFLSTNFYKTIISVSGNQGFLDLVLSIVVPMLIVYNIIEYGAKLAKQYAGEFGNMVQNFADKSFGNAGTLAGGALLGIASGGTSLFGTAAARTIALSNAKKDELEAKKAQGGFGGWIADKRLGFNSWTQKQTFDPRRTDALKAFGKAAGINMDNRVVNTLGFGQKRTDGGVASMVSRSEKKEKEKIKKIGVTNVSDKDAEAFWNNHVKKQTQKEADAAFFAKLKTEGKTDEEIKGIKNSKYRESALYEEHATKAREDFERKGDYGKVKSKKDLNQNLRQEYILSKQKGNMFTNAFVSSVAQPSGTLGLSAAGAGLVGAGAVPLIVGAVVEGEGRQKAYRDELKAIKKSRTKPPQEDRLEALNAKNEKELEVIEETLKKIYTKGTKPASYTGDVVDYYKENFEKAQELIANYRERLEVDMESLDLDIKRIDNEYQIALRAGNSKLAAEKELERNAKIASKKSKEYEHRKLDPKRKRDLENEINRNEDLLNKIKEKKTKSEEKDTPKKESAGEPPKK